MSDKAKKKSKPSSKKKTISSSKSKSKNKKTSSKKVEENKSKQDQSIDIKNSTELLDSSINPQNLMNSQEINQQKQIPQNISNKCEGCFQGEGYVFCITCGKVFCRICDDQLHNLIPAFKSHERTPLTTLYSMTMNCYHHNQPLRYYCENCDEPVCNLCLELGPHNNVLHKTTSIFDYYKNKFMFVKNKVDGVLTEKCNKIENLMLKIDNKIKETKSKVYNIINGINKEYEFVTENLNKCSGKKKAVLNYNCALIQKDVMTINSILEFLKKSKISDINDNISNNQNNDSNTKMITFLLKYKSINETLEKIISKPIHAYSITNDEYNELISWPNDIDSINEKLIAFDKIKVLIKIKEDIIWNLLTKDKPIPELDKIRNESHKEIEEWSKLGDKYAKEMDKYNMVCAYCGCYLDNTKVNEKCPKNNNNKFISSNYTINPPPDIFNGNKRHYFETPTQEYAAMISRDLPDLDNNPFKKNKKQSNIINKSTKEYNKKKWLNSDTKNDWVIKIASIIEKENINLYQVLSDLDSDRDGFITTSDLLVALVRVNIELDSEQKDALLRYLSMNNNYSGLVDIKDFSKNFMSKKSIEEIENIQKLSKLKDSVELKKTIKINLDDEGNPFNNNYISNN